MWPPQTDPVHRVAERLINERAVLNAVDGLIKLASIRELPGRKIV